MASQAHGEPITGSSLTASPFSTKKKKKYRVRNWTQSTHHVASAWHHVASSLAERSNPNTKANQTQNSANQTQSTEVFIKKKKIPNTQTKIKPSKPLTHGRSRRRRHRRSELVVIVVVRLVAPHRRSEIGERRWLCLCSSARCSSLGAPSGPPSRYFTLFSLWLFLNLSLFNLYLTEIKNEMNNRRSTS